jgi:hypothetical protein
MGYQLIEATKRDGRREQGVAYNAELMFRGTETQTPLHLHSFKTLLRLAEGSRGEYTEFRLLSRETKTFRASVRAPSGVAKAAPAEDGDVEKTRTGEVFVRFSAYENDRRVTQTKVSSPEATQRPRRTPRR